MPLVKISKKHACGLFTSIIWLSRRVIGCEVVEHIRSTPATITATRTSVTTIPVWPVGWITRSWLTRSYTWILTRQGRELCGQLELADTFFREKRSDFLQIAKYFLLCRHQNVKIQGWIRTHAGCSPNEHAKSPQVGQGKSDQQYYFCPGHWMLTGELSMQFLCSSCFWSIKYADRSALLLLPVGQGPSHNRSELSNIVLERLHP